MWLSEYLGYWDADWFGAMEEPEPTPAPSAGFIVRRKPQDALVLRTLGPGIGATNTMRLAVIGSI